MLGSDVRRLVELCDVFVQYHFDGICARDTLIAIRPQQHFIIVNTLTSQSGPDETGHWILLLRSNSVLHCWDPLGWRSANNDMFLNTDLMKDIRHVMLSVRPYQPPDSTLCGAYCVFTACQLLMHIDEPISHVLSETFADDLPENEAKVVSFIHILQSQMSEQET